MNKKSNKKSIRKRKKQSSDVVYVRKKEFKCTFSLIKWEKYNPTEQFNPKNSPVLQSIEKFSLFRAKALQEFLQDGLDTKPLDKESIEWYKLNLSRLNNILDGTQGEFFSSLTHVYHSNTFSQKSSKVPIGRLYSQKKFSYMFLPREIRGFLVQNEYMDFDIVNSHPTLLLEFARENISNIFFHHLEKYVQNRDQVLEIKATLDQTTKSKAKESILTTLNAKKKEHVDVLGHFCPELYLEILTIRKHIVNFVGKDIEVYCKDNSAYEMKETKEEQDVSTQSLFLQTKETEYLVQLVGFLVEKTLSTLTEKKLKDSFDEMLLDRYVILPDWFYYLSFIPFFDGLYLSTEDPMYKNILRKHVRKFNLYLKDKGSLVQFVEKEITFEPKHLCESKLNFYLTVNSYLKDITIRQLRELFILLDMPEISFNSTNEEDMKTVVKVQRRLFYEKLYQNSKKCDTPLNSDFLKKIRNVYKDRMEKYKEKVKLSDNNLFTEENYTNYPIFTNGESSDDD